MIVMRQLINELYRLICPATEVDLLKIISLSPSLQITLFQFFNRMIGRPGSKRHKSKRRA
jgi:hypothetical protein